MKFGKHLEANVNQPWRFHFLDYVSLKQFLKSNKPPAWGPNHEEVFIKMLNEELKKVSEFEALKYKELERHIAHLEREVVKIEKSDENDKETEESEVKQRIKRELDVVTSDISNLAKFNSLNYTGFLKILKKHDKTTNMNLKHTFLIHLGTQPFYKETFDVAIVKLSSLYEKLKTKNGPVAGSVSTTSFVRKTTKYWVHPDNVMEVKCIILRHLPVLVFGRDDRSKFDSCITSIYFDNDPMELYHERIEKVELATAVRFRWYGEHPREIFIERKTHHEDWTGETSVKERFPIKEKHVNDFCKGKYTLEKEGERWLSLGKSQEEVTKMLELSTAVQAQLVDRKLKPVMRTFYNRTAFQLPNTAEVRISLDTELTMVNENNKTDGNWYRKDVGVEFPFLHIAESDINRFPYAVLEVKLQTCVGDEPPAWITELIESHLVEPVPKFSKFIHGCATMLEGSVKLLPFWLPQMEKDIRKAPHQTQRSFLNSTEDLQPLPSTGYIPYNSPKHSFQDDIETAVDMRTGSYGTSPSGVPLSRAEYPDDESIDETTSLLNGRRKRNINILNSISSGKSFIRERLLGGNSGGNSNNNNSNNGEQPRQPKPIAIPVRIEPKVFFANERTFLNWLHTSVLISTIGLALLNLNPGKHGGSGSNQSARSSAVAGLTLVPVAIMFLIYALYTYFWRDRMIRNRSPGPYNTVGGPIVITMIFCVALVINYIIWWVDHGTDPDKWFV